MTREVGPDGAEHEAADQRLFNDGREDDRHGHHDVLVVGDERADGLVVIDREAGGQLRECELQNPRARVIQREPQHHRLHEIPERTAEIRLPQKAVEDKQRGGEIDGKIGDVDRQRAHAERELFVRQLPEADSK